MDKAHRSKETSETAPTGSEQSSTPANAEAGSWGSMSMLSEWMGLGGGAEEEESELLSEQGGPSRVTGTGADAIVDALGEPTWAVQDNNEYEYFRDRMEVVTCVHYGAEDSKKPSSDLLYDDSCLGYQSAVGNSMTYHWNPLYPNTTGGIRMVYLQHHDGSVDAYAVNYIAARPKENNYQKMMGPNGEWTAPYVLGRTQQGLFKFINAISPADNILEFATRRDLDPTGDDFGKELSSEELAIVGLEGIVESLVILKGASMGAAAQKTWLAERLTEGTVAALEPLIDVAKESGADPNQVLVLELVLKCIAGKQHMGKLLSGDLRKMKPKEWLETIETLVDAGEIVAKRVLGEKAFTEHYGELKKDFDLMRKNRQTYHAIKDLMR